MLTRKNLLLCVCGSCVLAFGLYNVHAFSRITEGGALGLTLLLQNWFDLSPAISAAVINLICYGIGIRTLGKKFLTYSLISALGFSLFYFLFEQFQPLLPELSDAPLIAALLGAVFVGVGVGLCVRAGGAPSGDDALAMCLSKILGIPIQWVYLITDLSILILSLTYIPVSRILYSLVTVVLSGQIIGLMQTKNAAQ